MKILVAEDDRTLRKKIKDLLEGMGCDVVEARDGREAFDRIFDDRAFDAIITDNQMPGICGANLLQAIGRDKCAPPTLLHSTEKMGYMNGADGRDRVDLSEFVGYFDFARFKLKLPSRDVGYIRDFVAGLQNKPA